MSRQKGSYKDRYERDARITIRIADECYRLVEEFFHGDVEKTKLWFETPNYLLGYVRPSEMIILGRAERLLQMIQNQLEENQAP